MNYISVCSGIEAASVAWHPLGWMPLAFSEIEPFPSAVLAHHYPTVPNLGDMTKYHDWPNFDAPPVNLIVGGTPCQAFSVAGLRQGLADPRGNLTLTFLGLVDRYRPEWVVWENVPGVLSDRTNAFGQLLAGLGQLGYGWAYRVLDAQYFGLAQRRKRVFVVANLGGWASAAAVLFESTCLRRDTPPSRETRQKIAPTLAARTKGGGGLGTDFDLDGGLVRGDGNVAIPIQEIGKRQSGTPMNGVGHGKNGDPMYTLQRGAVHGVATVAPCLKGNQGKNSDAAMEASSLVLIPTHQGGFFDERGLRFLCRNCGRKFGVDDYPRNPTCPDCRCMTVDDLLQGDSFPAGTKLAFAEPGSPNNPEPIAFHPTQDPISSIDGTTHAMGCGSKQGTATIAVKQQMSVRRLTPTECERLQGFPDGYTNIPWRKKPTAPDGPRYKALGNSMAVNCMAWIGHRIEWRHNWAQPFDL